MIALLPSLILCATAISSRAASIARRDSSWVGIWEGVAQPRNFADNTDNTRKDDFYLPQTNGTTDGPWFYDATIRQTVHITLATDTIRINISNVFGSDDLYIGDMSVAPALVYSGIAAGSPIIDPSAAVAVTFNGGDSTISIPAGQAIYTDPISIDLDTHDDLSISLYLPNGIRGDQLTGHLRAHTNVFYSRGNNVESGDLSQSIKDNRWWFIDSVDGVVPGAYALVAVGDSITDHQGSDMNQTNGWVDFLFNQTQEVSSLQKLSFVDAGIGGNCINSDGCREPNTVSRFQRDVLGVAGINFAFVLEGVNDIHKQPPNDTSQDTYDRIINGYKIVAQQAKDAGVSIGIGTVLPFATPDWSTGNAYATPGRLQTWQDVNAWIRDESGPWFDWVVDWAPALANSSAPDSMDSTYNSGDWLHPNPAGSKVMAEQWQQVLDSGILVV